jgi:transposase
MPIPLRSDCDAARVRVAARESKNANQVRRLLALAAIYDGASRAEAAEIGGVTRQIIRDWVLKFNTDGPDGLIDRKAPGQPSRLNETHRTALAAVIESGPIPAVHGVVRWRIVDLCQWLWDEFRVSVSKQTLGRELRAMRYRKLSARPRHHGQAEGAIEAFKTYGPPRLQAMFRAGPSSPRKRIRPEDKRPRPRWRSAHPGPHKSFGVETPFLKPGFQSAGSTVGPSLASTTRRPRS